MSNTDKLYTQEERDLFAMAFAVWCMGPEGEMYRATKMSLYKLLKTYMDRPYIDVQNPQQQ